MIEKIGKYWVRLKPHYEIRVILLQKEVFCILKILQEYKDEWKKIGCMSNSWTDTKRLSIYDFIVISPVWGTNFLSSIITVDISNITEKVF